MEVPPPAAENTSVSDVLDTRDLLEKILLRLECRSCLVSAALTSKHWLRSASKLVVPDFCARHQPRLLGVYVSSAGISGAEFIPLLQPDPSRPVVTDVLNHADFGFGDLPEPNVWDCRNGLVLFELGGGETLHPTRLAVRRPLLYPIPNMDKALLLPQTPQPSYFTEHPDALLIPADHGDDALCYRVSVRIWESAGNTTRGLALVWAMRSGSWDIHCIATGPLTKPPIEIMPTAVLAGGKIYMATQAGYILGVNLATQGFFIVDLPEGVELDYYPGKAHHCRGGDSDLYLFHVDAESRLNVWFRRMNDGDGHGEAAGAAGGASGSNGWVLQDTISVRETCGHLVEQGWEAAGFGDEGAEVVTVVGAGDNAEFVFLELGITSGVIVYMHVKTREVKQVYQREPDDDYLITVRPFMFVGPTVFPAALVAEEGEAAAAQHQE